MQASRCRTSIYGTSTCYWRPGDVTIRRFKGAGAGDEPRPACQCCVPSTSSTRDRLEQDPRPAVQLDTVVIRFAGDSGDGMQLAGMQFTIESALAGNDIATLPDFPAEIRAPAGTLAGVSGFQLNFSSREVFTAGDEPDVLVAMNPAALKANLDDLKPNGMLIVDSEAFTEANLKKAGYAVNPLTDGSLDRYRVFGVDITKLTTNALVESGLEQSRRVALQELLRARPHVVDLSTADRADAQVDREKFKKTPELAAANARVLRAGYNYGETTEIFLTVLRGAAGEDLAREVPQHHRQHRHRPRVRRRGETQRAAAVPRQLSDHARQRHPARARHLQELRRLHVPGRRRDRGRSAPRSARPSAARSAITTTSGPGMNLKAEAVGLAVKAELPLVITDIQRGGPSTGMPTKTEQADLLLAMYGRHGECPIPIIAASTPADCFATAFEAVRIAVKYMTPVILLTDGHLANGAEPWLIPRAANLPEIKVEFRTDPAGYQPYLRDETTLARPWVVPGTPGLEHRIGGLEREHLTGNVSYAPANHEQMVRMRARKIAGIAAEIPPTRSLRRRRKATS